MINFFIYSLGVQCELDPLIDHEENNKLRNKQTERGADQRHTWSLDNFKDDEASTRF